jgi:hypothetical protein
VTTCGVCTQEGARRRRCFPPQRRRKRYQVQLGGKRARRWLAALLILLWLALTVWGVIFTFWPRQGGQSVYALARSLGSTWHSAIPVGVYVLVTIRVFREASRLWIRRDEDDDLGL